MPNGTETFSNKPNDNSLTQNCCDRNNIKKCLKKRNISREMPKASKNRLKS